LKNHWFSEYTQRTCDGAKKNVKSAKLILTHYVLSGAFPFLYHEKERDSYFEE
jgi:hypothetical protein